MNIKKTLMLEKADLHQKISDLNNEIESLEMSLSKCQCNEYRKMISSLEKEEICLQNDLKAKKSNKSEYLQSVLNQNQSVLNEINQIQQKIIQKKQEMIQLSESTNQKINEIEQKHQESIKTIEIRVKQTISKKDEKIKELTLLLRNYGIK